MAKGVCQCKYGECTASGTCPTSSSNMGGVSRLYDDSMSVPGVNDVEADDYTMAERVPFGLLFIGLFAMVIVFGLRVHRAARTVAEGDDSNEDGFLAEE